MTISPGDSRQRRTATLSLSGIPLVTGSPDVDASTIGGIGPSSWSGQSLLTFPSGSLPILIPPRSVPAYGPSNFLNFAKKIVPIGISSSGVTYFSDSQGHRVWSAWAATAYPVKITGLLTRGQTVVCGKATPNIGVTIFDATNAPQLASIGSGSADGNGNFCISVNPALYRNEVIVARDTNNTYSQPVVVAYTVYLPFVQH